MVPKDILKNVAGVAIISEVKVGLGFWSGRLGTGEISFCCAIVHTTCLVITKCTLEVLS